MLVKFPNAGKWSDNRKNIARLLESGRGPYDLRKNKVPGFGDAFYILHEMERIIKAGEPRPWVDNSASTNSASTQTSNTNVPSVSSLQPNKLIEKKETNMNKKSSTAEGTTNGDVDGNGHSKQPVPEKSSSVNVKGKKPASLFSVKVKGEDIEISTEELTDMYEVWLAWKQEGYAGTPMQLARYCMVKITALLDIQPKLYTEVLNARQL